MYDNKQHKIILIFVALFSLIAVGTSGYMVLEGMDLLDALYMTVDWPDCAGYKKAG